MRHSTFLARAQTPEAIAPVPTDHRRPGSARLIIIVFFNAIAVRHMSAVFDARLLSVLPRLERTADRFGAAGKATFGIVSAMIAPDNDFEFPHLGFSN